MVEEPTTEVVVDGIGRVFGTVSLAHQTCLQLEDVLRAALDDIHPMATTKSHARTPSATTTGTNDGDNPQNMVITSLRGQVSDLVSQVTQLNSKLVQSYDRISDLEDNMHIASSNLRNSTLKISQLELERTQHLSALNTGLLVEKSHVTAELTRLMEKATDEAAQRGMAESARQEIEKDLDDLSAELFGRANTMVAEARLAQAKSERRVQDAEAVLKGAEEAVGSMQAQMQTLREEKEKTDRDLLQTRELMGKGKWVERERSSPSLPLKLLSTHVPYQEFLLFVAHLRQIRPVTPQVPPMATLLPLPFLARLVSEDSDPTLRLDSAPSLNWLTRRSVISAIHQSQLTVEPLSVHALLEFFAPNASAAMSAFATYSTQVSAASQQQQPVNVTCALCGKSVLPSSVVPAHHAPANGTGTNSWRPTFFSKSSNGGTPTRQSSPAIHSPTPSVATSISFYPPSNSSGPGRLSPPPTPPLPSPPISPQVYVFRLQPASQTGSSTGAPGTVYPLCTSGWCLARLRTTCELWRFVRHGVVERVWEEEVPDIGLVTQSQRTAQASTKPPVPPRRRLPSTMGVGKLIGMASSALGMEKVANGKNGSGSGSSTPTKQEERLSPAPQRSSDGSASKRRLTLANGAPPPLPRRNEGRTTSKAEDEKVEEPPRVEVDRGDEALSEKKTLSVEPSSHLDVEATSTGASSVYSVEDAKTPELENATATTDGPTMITTALSAEPEEFVTPDGTPAQSPSSVIRNPSNVNRDPTQVPLPDSPAVAAFVASSPESEMKEPPTHEGAETSDPITPKVEDNSSPLEERQTTNDALAPPERIASPAIPSRTASPAPPPLPKRAARRAVPPPPGPGASAQATSTEAEPAGSADAIETEARAEQQDTAAPAPPPPVHPSHAAPAQPAQHDLPPPPTHPNVRDASPSSSPRRVPPPLSAPIPPAKVTPSLEEEPGSYVGDATWEERTWKELVRLREDMFFARAGTVR